MSTKTLYTYEDWVKAFEYWKFNRSEEAWRACCEIRDALDLSKANSIPEGTYQHVTELFDETDLG